MIEEYNPDKKDYTMSQEVIFCANCQHCIVIRKFEPQPGSYVLRVKCLKQMWRKRSGEEKLHKYFTVARRRIKECDYYLETGDLYPYIKTLAKELPFKDEIYYE